MKWHKPLKPYLSPRSIWLVLSFAVAAFLLGLFLELTFELKAGPTIHGIDEKLLLLTSKLRIPSLNGPAVDFTALGSTSLLATFSLLGIFIFWLRKNSLDAIHLALAGIGAGLGTTLLKNFIARQRPQIIAPLVEVLGYSYPSGHSLSASAILFTLTLLACRSFPFLWQRCSLIGLCLTILVVIGFSRVYLGVHYPSDTLAGTLLGISWALFLMCLFSLFRLARDRSNSKQDRPSLANH